MSGLRFIPRGWRVLCGLASPPLLEQRTQVNHSEYEPMPFSNGLDVKTNPSGSDHHQNHILTQLFVPLPSLKDKEPRVLICEKKAEGLSPRSHPQSTHTQSTVSPVQPRLTPTLSKPQIHARIHCADLLQCSGSSLTPPSLCHFPLLPRVPYTHPCGGDSLLHRGKSHSCVSALKTPSLVGLLLVSLCGETAVTSHALIEQPSFLMLPIIGRYLAHQQVCLRNLQLIKGLMNLLLVVTWSGKAPATTGQC